MECQNLSYELLRKEFEYEIYKTGLIADSFIWNNLYKLNVPTLIIKAEYSNAFLDNSVKQIEKIGNKNIKIITLKNVTHLFPLEKPYETAQLILDFIN